MLASWRTRTVSPEPSSALILVPCSSTDGAQTEPKQISLRRVTPWPELVTRFSQLTSFFALGCFKFSLLYFPYSQIWIFLWHDQLPAYKCGTGIMHDPVQSRGPAASWELELTFPWWSVQLSDLVEEHLQWSHSRAKHAASDRQLCGNFGRSSLAKFNRWQQREDIEQCSRLEMKQPTIQSLIFWFQGSFWNKKLVKEYLENISQCLFKLSWIKMYQLNNYSFPS